MFSKKSASTSLSLRTTRSANMSWDGNVSTRTERMAMNSWRTVYGEKIFDNKFHKTFLKKHISYSIKCNWFVQYLTCLCFLPTNCNTIMHYHYMKSKFELQFLVLICVSTYLFLVLEACLDLLNQSVWYQFSEVVLVIRHNTELLHHGNQCVGGVVS